MSITKIKDVDFMIMQNMDDRTLLSFCVTNQKSNALCNDERFWEKRFYDKLLLYYPHGSFSKSKRITWKNLYLSILRYMQLKDENSSPTIEDYIGGMLTMGDDKLEQLGYKYEEDKSEKMNLARKKVYYKSIDFDNKNSSFYKMEMYKYLKKGGDVYHFFVLEIIRWILFKIKEIIIEDNFSSMTEKEIDEIVAKNKDKFVTMAYKIYELVKNKQQLDKIPSFSKEDYYNLIQEITQDTL